MVLNQGNTINLTIDTTSERNNEEARPLSSLSPTSSSSSSSSSYREICKLMSFLIFIFLFFLIVIVFYMEHEDWNLTDTMYFIIVTISTVGYGQPAPSDDGARLFTIFFIIIGISVIFAGTEGFIQTNLPMLRNFFCKSHRKQIKEDIESGNIYHYRKRLIFFTFLITILMIIGAIAVKENEDWTWIQSFYFIVETSSTVGYGDLSITRGSTKVFLCVYICISTILVTLIIRSFNASLEEQDQLKTYETRLLRLQQAHQIYSATEGSSLKSLLSPTKPLTTEKLLLDLLIYSGKLNPVTDLDPWRASLEAIANERNEITSIEKLDAFLLKESESAAVKLNQFREWKRFNLTTWLSSLLPWLTRVERTYSDTQEEVVNLNLRRPVPEELTFTSDYIYGDEEAVIGDGVQLVRSPFNQKRQYSRIIQEQNLGDTSIDSER